MDLDPGGGGDGTVEALEPSAAAAEQDALALDVAHQALRRVGEDRVERCEDRPHVRVEAPVQLGRGDREVLLAALTAAPDLQSRAPRAGRPGRATR